MNQATFNHLITRASSDPLVGFALIAAAVILVVGVAEAFLDGEVARLKRARSWVAIPVALLLTMALEAARMFAPATDLSLTPLVLAPLLVLTYAMGPLTGVLLSSAWLALGAPQGVFAIEDLRLVVILVAVGWIGLGRTRRTRHLPWLPAIAILGSWALASSTYSLALWGIDNPGADVGLLVQQFAPPALMWTVLAFVVTLPPAGFWSWLAGDAKANAVHAEPVDTHALALESARGFSDRREERNARRLKRTLTPPVTEPLERIRSLQAPRDSE